ncbi:MAG: hypothetical protein M1820_007881 [Bogoriella megaspora]|nr:MAG: hypothetical protein M1820_007881 [Bogoriella megaspora]
MSPIPPTSHAQLIVNNIEDYETVHQRCVLIHGQCLASIGYVPKQDGYISIETVDNFNDSAFPKQTWPLANGHFTALAFLNPGTNELLLKWQEDTTVALLKLNITYVPLLQNPPLHLAVLVAKDSPLLIDCPAGRYGGISSTHASLDAAITKFRLTAYMWQAFTAEDMRRKGLGRRSFRFNEEWACDTVSSAFQYASTENMLWNGAMQSTAKVHIIPCDKTVAELRDAQLAQQNRNARRANDLHMILSNALKAYGGPFTSSAHPVVAGLILDSHFSPQQNLILGHAALGAHDPSGLSLGVFGSHLCYSWPRFIEEVASSLLDTRVPGDTVGNDNNECDTMWEACSIGQGAFLHEVGHAFGAPHTSGIMARGYAQHWPRNFLAQTAYCAAKKENGINTYETGVENNATWDIRDALSFRLQPHFRLPTDPKAWIAAKDTVPAVEILDDDEDFPRIALRGSMGGIVRVRFNDEVKHEFSVNETQNEILYTLAELEDATTPPRQKLSIEVLGLNGKIRFVSDVWRLLASRSYIRVPGSSTRLLKRAIACEGRNEEHQNDNTRKNEWEWTVMLKKKGKDGTLVDANAIDLRVGCILDGAYMYYDDGSRMNLGPRWRADGGEHTFGGHASEKLDIPKGANITKIEIKVEGWSCLGGFRLTLDNGTKAGELNMGSSPASSVLEPEQGQKIVGFFGTSERHGCGAMKELGIITAPTDFEIPEEMYEMSELQNTDGGTGRRPNQRARWNDDATITDDEDENEDFAEHMDEN